MPTTLATSTPTFREVIHSHSWAQRVPPGRYVLACDIGGTNSNFGVMKCDDDQLLLCASFHARSQQVTDYALLVATLLQLIHERYKLTITDVCIGAAGVIGQFRDNVKPTNLNVTINIEDFKRIIPTIHVSIINDFEAVGLGIPHIAPQSIVTVHAGAPRPGAQRASIGAGTGLGKVALIWHEHAHSYLPLASEGGHADFAAQTPQECALLEYFREQWTHGCPISWEDVLSGIGIGRIYQFLGSAGSYPNTAVSEDIRQHNFKPDLISHYAQQDGQCLDTWAIYARLYARCAKNYALDTLSLDGMYIAGGIAAKNVGMFASPHFHDEFQACGKQHALLRSMPVYVIADYNVSLYGAAAYIILHERGYL